MRFIESGRRITQEITRFQEGEEVSSWLWHTLELHYSPQIRNEKERQDFEDFWGVHDAPVEGIGNIYANLQTEKHKLLFRQSIGNVLTQHADDKDAPPDALRDLIYLISTTKAVESLNSLVPTIGNGSLGKKHPEYLYETLAVLMDLSPSPEAQATTSQLVDCPNFDDGYIFSAIGILAQGDPSNVFNLLARFQPRIESLRQTVRDLGGAEWTAFTDCLDDLIVKILRIDSKADTNTIKQIFLG